jgi:hypothetical protein
MEHPALGIFGLLSPAKRAASRLCGSKWAVYTSAANVVETFGQARVYVGGENGLALGARFCGTATLGCPCRFIPALTDSQEWLTHDKLSDLIFVREF